MRLQEETILVRTGCLTLDSELPLPLATAILFSNGVNSFSFFWSDFNECVRELKIIINDRIALAFALVSLSSLTLTHSHTHMHGTHRYLTRHGIICTWFVFHHYDYWWCWCGCCCSFFVDFSLCWRMRVSMSALSIHLLFYRRVHESLVSVSFCEQNKLQAPLF